MLSLLGALVQFLVGELRSCKLRGRCSQKKKKQKIQFGVMVNTRKKINGGKR